MVGYVKIGIRGGHLLEWQCIYRYERIEVSTLSSKCKRSTS